MTYGAKYSPLTRRLSSLEIDSQAFSFGDIEKILGRPLPPSARSNHARQWWANTATHSQGQAWIEAGWHVEGLDLKEQKVRFRRVGPKAGRSVARHVDPAGGDVDIATVNRMQLSVRAQRMVDDYRDATGADLADAILHILEDAALERRRKIILQITARAPNIPGDSTGLIREDRDAR